MTLDRFDRWIGGHIRLGPVVVYGRNAMHWAVNIRTKRWGYVCFRLPFRCFGKWWPLYFYLSPNATPWAATFLLGRRHDGVDNRGTEPKHRRALFGHGVSPTDEALDYLGDAVKSASVELLRHE